MAGRKPLSIPDQVERLPGSPLAKERLRVILANLAGALSPSQACAELGNEESWYFELRHRALGRWSRRWSPSRPGGGPRRRPGWSRSESPSSKTKSNDWSWNCRRRNCARS